MGNQSKMTNSSGKKCGKKLTCKHVCQEEASTEHICACSWKWTLDPGCGHTVTGNCAQSPSEALSQDCLSKCGQLLDCGHPCKEKCANACVCLECNSDIANFQLDNKNPVESAGSVVVQAPPSFANESALATSSGQIGQITGPNVASGFEITTSDSQVAGKFTPFVPATSAQTPTRKPVKKFPPTQTQIPMNNINCTPVLKLTTPKPNAKPNGFGSFGCNLPSTVRGSSPQPSTSRATANQNTDFMDTYGIPEPKPVDQLPAHQLEQLKKLLPTSAFDTNSNNPWDELYMFTQCINQHLFAMDKQYCPVCGYLRVGPLVTLIKEGVSAESAIPAEELDEIVLDDDNAWKLGFAKCSNAHYFYAGLPRCDICGEVSMFYMGSDGGDSC